VARTALFTAGLGLLFAWSWARLEAPHPGAGVLALMIALGVGPALLPTRRLRLAAFGVGLFVAGMVSLDVSRPWALGALLGRAGRGFLDFYDVLVPFDGGDYPNMHGDVLLAVFIFTALAGLAIAARRPLAATIVLVAGTGWPSTIMPGSDDLGRGAIVFAVALALVAGLRPQGRRAPPQVLTGTALVIAALILSSSSSVAKGQFLSWQSWDLYSKPGKRVSVSYVWRSNYNGIRFPTEKTRVFTVAAPKRSTYWRATTLDAFQNDRWEEDLFAISGTFESSPVDLSQDELLAPGSRNERLQQRADVTIDALRDVHLVGPPQPVRYAAADAGVVQYEQGGVARASRAPGQNVKYTVWGYTPQPTPAKLARSPADYPPDISLFGLYLRLQHSQSVPPFGTPEHAIWARQYFRRADGARYKPVYDEAIRVAGNATSPYAAAVALEAWLRSSGGFHYDEQPGRSRGIPPLVRFVTRSKRGYCQHFAGAMALMLRYMGIPARVAAGFTSGKYDSKRGIWTVNDRDAHTWVEVWFKGYGWLPFDPTPGRGTLSGPYTMSSTSFDARGAARVLTASAIAGQTLLRAQLSALGRELLVPPGSKPPKAAGGASPSRGAQDQGTRLAPFVILGTLVLAVLFLLLKLVVRRSRFLTRDPRRIAAASRREIVDFLRDQRIEAPRSMAPRELGALLARRAGVEATDFADALGTARFAPEPSASAAVPELRRELRAVRRRLRRVLPLGRRVRGAFSIRSLAGS
jgi:transglutaminase-like putative cysteine protease